ncbi:MAG: hypothetical protein ABIZ72_10770 [Candidatus Limnocylindrales bacterium]
MFKTFARILLLRVLPRRILPVVTVVEALLFLRGIRNRSRLADRPPGASGSAPSVRRPAADWGARRPPEDPNRPVSGS